MHRESWRRDGRDPVQGSVRERDEQEIGRCRKRAPAACHLVKQELRAVSVGISVATSVGAGVSEGRARRLASLQISVSEWDSECDDGQAGDARNHN